MILTFILDSDQLENFNEQYYLSGTWILTKTCLLYAVTNVNNLILTSQ